MKTILILPTYNETDNLPRMIQEIFVHLPSAQVMVVDDNSPDGTGTLAEKISAENPGKILVVHRKKKEGLGKAYMEGFRRALDAGADLVIHMDCDFSHPPEVLPQLVSALEKYDFVLGSRYIPGGGTQNWPLKRRLLSRMGNLYARTILGLPVRDLTGGFKGFRSRVLKHLLQYPIDSQGYNFQIEVTLRAIRSGFSYTEIPFIFPERELGESKMSGGIIWEAFRKTFALRKILKEQNPRP
jgi:dolichol-phosphate mannosyltransferase